MNKSIVIALTCLGIIAAARVLMLVNTLLATGMISIQFFIPTENLKGSGPLFSCALSYRGERCRNIFERFIVNFVYSKTLMEKSI